MRVRAATGLGTRGFGMETMQERMTHSVAGSATYRCAVMARVPYHISASTAACSTTVEKIARSQE